MDSENALGHDLISDQVNRNTQPPTVIKLHSDHLLLFDDTQSAP
jgi:hypothetical protein